VIEAGGSRRTHAVLSFSVFKTLLLFLLSEAGSTGSELRDKPHESWKQSSKKNDSKWTLIVWPVNHLAFMRNYDAVTKVFLPPPIAATSV
jgi:hypothetical protein